MDFFTLLTTIGIQKLAAAVSSGTTLGLTQFAVGSGAIPIDETVQALGTEEFRAAINDIRIDPLDATQIIVEALIPQEVGGFTITEAAIIDDAGAFFAVSRVPTSTKAAPESGAAGEMIIKFILTVGNTSAVQLIVDNTTVTATREYVDSKIVDASLTQKGIVQLSSAVDSASESLAATPKAVSDVRLQLLATIATEVATLVDAAPGALDTLNELAAALGNDPNFATSVINTLASKVSATTFNFETYFMGQL
ncbi:MAG: phage tail protein [Pseudomonadales bacterium]|nr:phage tail protein [Pseudomonadales bacterium]